MTYAEEIQDFLQNGYKSIDFTCNGKCSKCGECCGFVLPLDKQDKEKIENYVIKNKIFPHKLKLVMEQKLQCPYYTGNKEKGCAIYEARPKICRIYKCDKMPKATEYIELRNTVPVYMWQFAENIERKMKNSGINKKTGKAIK